MSRTHSALVWASSLAGASLVLGCAGDTTDNMASQRAAPMATQGALPFAQTTPAVPTPLPLNPAPLPEVVPSATQPPLPGNPAPSTPGQTEPAGPTPEPAPLPVREAFAGRLTAEQYRNAVLDVLGIALTQEERSPVGGGIPREKNSTGLFTNGADGQAAADDYPLAFGRLAASIVERVDIPQLQAVAGCGGGETVACRDAWISELGLRLFRRPLSERERALYQMLHDRVTGLDTFEQAQKSVLEAFLQAPAFLFRLEQELASPPTSERYLDAFELASRLSFFLWNSVPDKTLLDAAKSGTLDVQDPALEGLRAQTQRMLADPKAKRMTSGFLADFAETERASFVGVTPELRAALVRSLQASFDVHLWDARKTLAELFTTTEMQFEPEVAELIGLAPVGPGLQAYDVSSLPQRVGLLTHPGFIAGIGEAQVGSLVTRGITLMVKLLCRQPLAVPDGLATVIEQVEAGFGDLTQRQRSEQRQLLAMPVSEGGGGNPACWGCHSQFEPLAYGFDRFDAAGRYLGDQDAQGREFPIDGWLTDDLNVPEAQRPRYADVAQQMQLMSASDAVQQCLTEHFVAYATGRATTAIEKAHAEQILSRHRKAGGTLEALAVAIATSAVFRKIGVQAP